MARMLVLVLIGLVLSGCSSFRDEKQVLRLDCAVPGTVVRVNGDEVPCPGEVKVRRDAKVVVEGVKEGYDKYYKEIGHHLSTAAKWDAVGTVVFVLPGLGLLQAGAWDLDESDVKVEMKKSGPAGCAVNTSGE